MTIDPLNTSASGSETGTMTMTTPRSSSEFELDGVKLKILTVGNVDIKTQQIKKEDRKNLDAREKREFEKAATEKQHPRYAFIATADSKSEDTLKESTTLSNLIAATKEVHHRYDMHDVFKLVVPKDVGKNPDLQMVTDSEGKTTPLRIDLYSEYVGVTQQMVADSCYWYNLYPDMEETPHFQENLRLTYENLVNVTTHALHLKVMEKYVRYEVEFRGGPLYFKIMIDYLVVHTERLSETIKKSIENYKISDLPGEDVSKAVTALRTNCTILYNIKKLPSDIETTLFKVYQTTSVPGFNDMFKSKHDQRRYELLNPSRGLTVGQLTRQTGPELTAEQDRLHRACNEINDIADMGYVDLQQEWNVPTKSKKDTATFPAAAERKGVRIYKATILLSGACWNCGNTDHNLHSCPKPKNERQIQANKKAFDSAKQRRGGGDTNPTQGNTGKWAPPRANENNRRVIDGKPMFFLPRGQKWVHDRDHQAGGVHFQERPPTTHDRQPPPPSNVSDAERDAETQRILTSTTEQFGSLMTSLATQLRRST